MIVKLLNTYLVTLLMTCCLAVAQGGAAQTFSGEIMDDLCAKNKSHDKMMQQMKSMGTDPVTCSQKCVQMGAHYVLYDRQKDAVYKLDNPEKAAPFAGKTVSISGTLEKNKIKIASIEPAGGGK